MVDSREIRRICKFCGKQFELSKSQMRQVKSKWPTNCSRSCARKAQHSRNHKHIRTEKECVMCGSKFTTTNWNNGKVYCSKKCASTARFGEKDNKKMLSKLNQILKDKKYLKYIENVAFKYSYKFGKCEEFGKEILQEYFLNLCNGNNTTIENVANSLIRKEIKRGVTGKWQSDFSFSTEQAMKFIKEKKTSLSSIEFKEYILDLYGSLSDFEREFITMYIKGFKDSEVMKMIRKKYPIGNERFYQEKKRLFREINYSNYGEKYKKITEY